MARLPLLLMLACPQAAAPQAQDAPATTPRPNVLFIMADQMRGDFLGSAGNAAVHSPHLDRLAAEGVRFTRAYSSTPSCTPARAAVLTGLSPWHHGMLGYYHLAERYPQELPRVVSAAGYRSWCIGKNHFHPQRNLHGYAGGELDESGRVYDEAFESDYRQWFHQQAPDLDPDATGVKWNEYPAKPYALPEALHPTRWTGDRAVAFLEQAEASQPFFLKVSFARPHSPYDAPQRLVDAVDPATLPPPITAAWSEAAFGSFRQPEKLSAARNNLGEGPTMAARRAYAANIAMIDEEIGRILATLKARGLLANTLIVFTSDHGDMLGDHHLWRKTYAYEGSTHVPFLLWWGKDLEARLLPQVARGQVRSELVELRDLLPTFAEAVGATLTRPVDGASLLTLLRGDGPPWRTMLDLEHATCYWPGNVWTALTDERWKYIFHAYDGHEQLFDLQEDPAERIDLAANPAFAETLATWRARMAAHLQERGEAWVKDGQPAVRKTTILLSPNFPPPPRNR